MVDAGTAMCYVGKCTQTNIIDSKVKWVSRVEHTTHSKCERGVLLLL